MRLFFINTHDENVDVETIGGILHPVDSVINEINCNEISKTVAKQ